MFATMNAEANKEAFHRLCASRPMLKDVRSAIEVLPGMTSNTVLTSGPPMDWSLYTGGQRDAIIGGALYEGLARDRAEVEEKVGSGDIIIAGCHDYASVGSLAGIYTASMPVFVVENAEFGNVGFCNIYEGTNPKRLNYGVYDETVRARLLFIQNVMAPVIGEAVRRSGGIALKPLMSRALHMGDELHSRNTAAGLLFTRELLPHLIEIAGGDLDAVQHTITGLTEDHYFFLRLSMAAAKTMADAAHDIDGCSVVTAMALNCRKFAIRVSGLGNQWFEGPHPIVQAKLFDGHTEDEITWMGGESMITETVGLGAFAQAAAFPLQQYQGGSPEEMVARNVELYKITIGEHSDFRIPFLRFRGTPTGIDIFRVAETGITPAIDMGIAGRNGGQIGAGIVRAPLSCFTDAREAFLKRWT